MAAPRYYRLDLKPDLAGRRFEGRVAIGLVGAGPAVVLDCEGLDIERVEAGGAALAWRQADGRLTVQAQGADEIVIAWSGPIGEEPRGLYGNGDWLLSQMQPTHARRVFPCFDDPAFRCPLELTVDAPPGLAVIGNAAVAGRDGGLVRFASTTPLPTNLLALAIGPFDSRQVEAGVPLTLHGLDSIVERAAVDALAFNMAWQGRPPAIGKLDILAAPRLKAAGMENIGAIFLQTEALAGPARDVAELVSHEVAHQWFGGLVSPAGWKDLWLNEGFATWMAAKALRAAGPDPDYEAVQARAVRAAMAVDTRPLRRDATSEAEIAERFDIAAYRKGAALLTLLEAWLGEEVFQAGVRRYAAQGAARGGTVTADDLWVALEAESGLPVSLVAAPLAERAGVPFLGFSRDGGDLVIRQLGEPRVTPVFVRTAAGVRTLLLKTVEARLPVDGWAYGNAAARGYYRCRHDFEVPLEGLDEAEIVALQEDAWDAAWAGELIGYLDLAGRLLAAGRGLDTLGPRLDELAELLAAGPRRAPFDAWRAVAPSGPLEDLRARWAQAAGVDADGRAAFRAAQQNRFDAWLLHRDVASDASPALIAEHHLVNAIAAALQGALWLRSAFDAEGLAAPPWMQAAGDLANVLVSVERVAVQQARGQPCAPDLSPLVQRLADDLAASAVMAEQALGRLAGSDAAAPRLVALLLGREAAAREREYEGARTFAALFGQPAPAAPPDAVDIRAWLEKSRKPIWRNDRLALKEAAAMIAADLRARAARLADGRPAGPFAPGRLRATPLPQAGKPLRLTLPDGGAVRADFPQDPVLRAQGLMHRERLAAGEGMLFELPDAGPHPFFMRAVRTPLDILWLDGEGRVLHVETGEPGSEDALPADLSRAVGRWVLELAGGEAAKRGLTPGAKVGGLPL